MHFKLGIIGHKRRIETIKNTLNEIYKNIEYITIESNSSTSFEEVTKELKYREHYLNGCYFTGVIPYKIQMGLTTPKIPWIYMKTDNSQLLSTLIKIESQNLGHLDCVSIDAYSKKDVLEIYEQIGINKLPLEINVSTLDIFDPEFLNNNLAFHLSCHKKNQSVCVTNISDTYNALQERKIPSLLLNPTKESIRNDFQELLMEHQLQKESKSQNVVFQISTDYFKDPILSVTSYKVLSEKAKLLDTLYTLSKRTSGILTENNKGGYMIFTSKDIFERNISNRALLSHLHDLSKAVTTSVSVGIGYGNTPHLAQIHSNHALHKAEKTGGNRAFIAYSETDMLGPLIPKKMDYSNTTVLDDLVSEIVNTTNLSSKTVQKLLDLKSDQSKEFYTPKELANEFGVTHRTMNRIIEKLEIEGYLEMVGKKMLTKSGRPTRIFKLNI